MMVVLSKTFFFFQSKTYMCSWQGDSLCFTVDFALGFTCFDSKTKVRIKGKKTQLCFILLLLKFLLTINFYVDQYGHFLC